jgi:hypothetical protein
MFLFFSTEQTSANVSFHKGRLFEDLLRRHLDASGFEVEWRAQKNNSLEYDISGRHRDDNRPIIGEAKAHEGTISGETVSAFIGKFVIQSQGRLRNGPEPSGLFLSTSPISPDAEDALRTLQSSGTYNIIAWYGAKLEARVRQSLSLPDDAAVVRALRQAVPSVNSQALLHTNVGTFIVAIGSGPGGGLPDRFAAVDSAGEPVMDQGFYRAVREGVSSLQEYAVPEVGEPRKGEKSRSVLEAAGPREIAEGLLLGTSWVDYRHPSPPQFFTGRDHPIRRVRELFAHSGRGVVVEVKARSGVGKSSLLALLADRWREAGVRVELHDARDVHSAVDVLALIRRFTQHDNPVASLEQVPQALEGGSERFGSTGGVFLVDQFESTFQTPEVFVAYEYLALCIARRGPGLALVYARKDDLLTTHDELRVSLDRLRSIADSVTLDDFGHDETVSLLRKIADDLPQRPNQRLLEQVAEFAQGFPWLIKRTMAHVVKMLKQRVSATELVSSGLHLEDLFEEELAELDELERGYLTRLVSSLPATLQTLARRFEGDPALPRMLERLTSRRLLRFSAGTYDTYNDVFKDFLLYDRLPERSHAVLYRMGPVAVLKAFRLLGGRKRIDVENFGKVLRRSLTATYNMLRELRVAGLVTRTREGWEVPDVIRQYEHQDRLGEYLRQSLMKNTAVIDFIAEVERAGSCSKADLRGLLRARFPFVEARDDIWESYTNTFLAWLRHLRLVSVADDIICVETSDRDHVVADLGNVLLTGRGSRPADAPFVPSKGIKVELALLRQCISSNLARSSLKRTEEVALTDLLNFGAVEVRNGQIYPLMTERQFLDKAQSMLGREPYSSFLDAVRRGSSYSIAATEHLGLRDLAPATRNNLGLKLYSWGKHFGIVPSIRRGKKKPGSAGLELFSTSSETSDDE